MTIKNVCWGCWPVLSLNASLPVGLKCNRIKQSLEPGLCPMRL